MAVSKTIEVAIYKGDDLLFFGTVNKTMMFPPQYVGELMKLVVEGFELEDADHTCLNDLHLHGHCSFSFGNGDEWSYRVTAKVSYPEKV